MSCPCLLIGQRRSSSTEAFKLTGYSASTSRRHKLRNFKVPHQKILPRPCTTAYQQEHKLEGVPRDALALCMFRRGCVDSSDVGRMEPITLCIALILVNYCRLPQIHCVACLRCHNSLLVEKAPSVRFVYHLRDTHEQRKLPHHIETSSL